MAAALLFTVASESGITREQKSGPLLHDAGLAAELVIEGLESPTSMSFFDGRIMVLQKDGHVKLVSNERLSDILKIDVATGAEQGLLGIAIFQNGNDTSVFLYMTERDDGVAKNRVYRYSYDGNERILANRTLLLDLPGEPGPYHNGGKIMIGPHDGHLYAVIGDVNSGGGILDNQIPGKSLDDKSVILRVDRETGLPAKDNPFYHQGGEMEKLQRYYAYGIRNSFGLDFDPVSQKLWMTENGPESYDEINIVEPGFNSGWHKVMGPISRTNMTAADLQILDAAAYRDPVFSWYLPIGVTDIEFLDSPELGAKYENNVFVGDINNGNLYFFSVNDDRTGLVLDKDLSDLVADPEDDPSSIIFGEGFGRITDIETGPDGCLYILSYEDGRIYRIVKQA